FNSVARAPDIFTRMKGRPPVRSSSSYELWWVIGFCLFAAVRVLFFSAAFPFFNNVDERRLFDLVIKYAEGTRAAQRRTDLAGNASLPLALRIARVSVGARR